MRKSPASHLTGAAEKQCDTDEVVKAFPLGLDAITHSCTILTVRVFSGLLNYQSSACRWLKPIVGSVVLAVISHRGWLFNSKSDFHCQLFAVIQRNAMAELMIISETGMFHSACRFTFSDSVQWRGFQPARRRNPVSPGKVERVDRTQYINHFVRISVNEAVLRRAMNAVTTEYSSKEYVLGGVDCVSFSADVARECRLRVPRVNMSPYGFIRMLTVWNDCIEFE